MTCKDADSKAPLPQVSTKSLSIDSEKKEQQKKLMPTKWLPDLACNGAYLRQTFKPVYVACESVHDNIDYEVKGNGLNNFIGISDTMQNWFII